MHPYLDLPFLVVSGLGRSGTTVLRHAVCAHPDLDGLNRESNYLFTLMREANLASENSNITNNLVVDLRAFWLAHRQLILELCWPKVSSKTIKAIATYTKLDPRAAMGLTETFPGFSLAYIVRNGIEVVSSFQSFPAFQHLSFEEACRIWSLRYDMIQYCRDNSHATLLRHEWISTEPEKWEAALEECFQRVGLHFHPDCRKPLQKTFHPTRYAGESRTDARDRERRKERWRLWSEDQRDSFEQICGDAMENLGYPIPWA